MPCLEGRDGGVIADAARETVHNVFVKETIGSFRNKMISTWTAEIGEICLKAQIGAVAQVRNDLLILGREKFLGFFS